MLVTGTRRLLDKGRNRIKSNQCWQSFILNLAIYPDCCVIFSSPLTNRSSRACLSVRPPNRFCQPAADYRRLDRGADLGGGAPWLPRPRSHMRRQAENKRARVLALGDPRGPREELSHNVGLGNFDSNFHSFAPTGWWNNQRLILSC